MRDAMRKYVEAGLGMLSSERAEELARDLIDWSRKNTERVVGLVQREVRRQMKALGVATQDEVRELRKRVRTLERQVEKAGRGGTRSSSKKSGAKKSSSKKSSSRKSSAKRSSSKGSGSSRTTGS